MLFWTLEFATDLHASCLFESPIQKSCKWNESSFPLQILSEYNDALINAMLCLTANLKLATAAAIAAAPGLSARNMKRG